MIRTMGSPALCAAASAKAPTPPGTGRAVVNNTYVDAENAGAQPMIANRMSMGGMERFYFENR